MNESNDTERYVFPIALGIGGSPSTGLLLLQIVYKLDVADPEEFQLRVALDRTQATALLEDLQWAMDELDSGL